MTGGVSDNPVWDHVNSKLKFSRTGGANAAIIETPNTTDLSALTVRVAFWGY
jgi:hypothetical protein